MSETFTAIKKEFYAYRNGIVADVLRKGGMKSKYIYGLQLPQLSEIARRVPHTLDLAMELWNDATCRESRLLAAYLFPPEEVDEALAERLASEVTDREQADILSFRLLKHLPCAPALHATILADPARFAAFPPASLTRHLSE